MPRSSVLDVLHSPTRFFRSEVGEPVRLGIPFAIVLGFVIFRVTGNYLIFDKMIGQLPPNLSDGVDWATFGFGMMMVATGVADFVFWFLASGILACTNILLDGDGEYRKLLELTGYAHLPLLIFALAVLAFGVTYSPKIDFGAYADLDLAALQKTDRERADMAMKGIEETMLSEVKKPIFVAYGSASICVYLWLGVLVLMANAESFRLTWKKSAISVLVVIGLHVMIEISRQKLFPGSI